MLQTSHKTLFTHGAESCLTSM